MKDKDKWNQKYKERMKKYEETSPNNRLINLTSYLKGGDALDLACGLGRNSLFLAQLSYQVQAFDISDVAVNYLREIAAKQNLPITAQAYDLTKLEDLGLENNVFDLVIITYYLDRQLFSKVKTIVKEKGYFFMETFYESPQNEKLNISNQFKLQPQELLHEFREWKILYFEEYEFEGRQTIFCQRP